MKVLTKIKDWLSYLWNDPDSIQEFRKYYVKVTLIDGEVIEFYTGRYYAIICSYSKYMSINLDRGLELFGKFYPTHMIKHIEDEVIDTQLVMSEGLAFGINGLTKEEIEDNQNKYSKVIYS